MSEFVIDSQNIEMQKALHLIQHTNRSLFLTGKAGTGKSTFLKYICSITKKKYVVLAPTGIAAINAGGSTLHSFFKIPFHPLVPNDVKFSVKHLQSALRYNGEKRKIIRELELIIIDEISMVRADIMDFIDKVLRVYSRNMREPFGGKQLLLVGDIYQLEPVLREDDRQLLSPFYTSGYFFDAAVFHQIQLVSIELRTVYRQSDPQFIGLLDRIRNNSVSSADLYALNSRVGTSQPQGHGHIGITLSARRDTVDYINQKELDGLPGSATTFYGEVTGEFPSSSMPTLTELELKVGAQIIFVKNDKDHRWVNGTLGVIEAIHESGDEEIGPWLSVITEEGNEYDVGREQWSNMRYTFNEKEKKIEEEEIGTFTQFPLRLAWAITVHKSQGLTFRHVNIDFSGGVFAGGQTYVALSRCTSLEGISLKEPIRRSDIFVKSEVVRFARQYNDNQVFEKALALSQADMEYRAAVKAFDEGHFGLFLDDFFKAIHHRYDIEKPLVKRYIRRKLHVINSLRSENERLHEEIKKKERFLRKLAAEYTLMGKDCEREQMFDAAKANYKKALELCPDAREPQRLLKRLSNRKSSQ